MSKLSVEDRLLSDLVVYRTYGKYLPESNRRETLDEVISRNMQTHLDRFPRLADEIHDAYKYVCTGKLMPSMRGLQFGGKAIEANHIRQYNCSFHNIDCIEAFWETLYLLLCGTGVGFSVQKHHISKLPKVTKSNESWYYPIHDSIEGWAMALQALVESYFLRKPKPQFDYFNIRPEGALLKTTGGRAPGPSKLKEMLETVEMKFESAVGRKLKSIEVHDIICIISDCVRAGGIRESALISLFSRDDDDMLNCKSGEWWKLHPYRARANNSAILPIRATGAVSHSGFIEYDEFAYVYSKCATSGAGEPGFQFSRDDTMGYNPCKPLNSTILTKDGYITFKQALQYDELEVITPSGKISKASKPFKTGENRVVAKISLSNGTHLYGTHNHRHMLLDGTWVEVKDLKVGDKLSTFTVSAYVMVKDIDLNHSVEDVYDITVYDDCHAFIDTNVVTHNCGEASLRSNQFCNLTSINLNAIDNLQEFTNVAKAATLIGTLQAAYTDLPFLNKRWQQVTEEDRLLGVSITGIADAHSRLDVTNNVLEKVANTVVITNQHYAQMLGINQAARTTLLKPEGSTSATLGTSSGIHARKGSNDGTYIRRVRVKTRTPLADFLWNNVPGLMEESAFNDGNSIISIPQRAPTGAILEKNEGAVDTFKRVIQYNKHWTKPGHVRGNNMHNVSCTLAVKDVEWAPLREEMWRHHQDYHGVSLLPFDNGTYVQAPFENCSLEQYNELVGYMKPLDFTQIVEVADDTTQAQAVACGGGACEIK